MICRDRCTYGNIKKNVVFDLEFNETLPELPNDVKTIIFNEDKHSAKFNKTINKNELPKSLQRLVLNYNV